MQELEQYLWSLTVDELNKHKKKLGLKTGGTKKDMISAIMKFYQTPNWIEDYFSTLKGFDKEYANLIIRENFNPIYEEVKSLVAKYNVKVDWHGRIEENLKFVINNYIPEIFRPTLLKLVPPIEIEFTEVEPEIVEGETVLIADSKNPIKKFDDFLMFITKYKVKATDKNGYVPKSSILKFIQESGIDEVVRKEDNDLADLKNQNDTIIVNGIVSLLKCNSVIKVKGDYFVLGDNYAKYVKLSPIDKVQFLLDGYLNSRYTKINEIERLTNYVFKYTLPLDLTPVRRTIIDYIKKLPIDGWVHSGRIKYFIRAKDSRFLRGNIGDIRAKDDYDNWYYTPGFNDLEGAIIDTFLMDCLAVLGIVDVYIEGDYNDRDTRFFLSTALVKLSSFGAKVLGLTAKEETESVLKPLIITPDFEIIVEEGVKRMEYELYFNRFFEKKFEDSTKSIYKLDFLGIAKSYDVKDVDVIGYILEECPDVPECVYEKFDFWMRSQGKIVIKKVTVLEAPDYLMKELLEDKKIAKFKEKSELEHIIISPKKARELKRNIESKEFLCEIED